MDVLKKAANANPLGLLFVGFAIGTIVGVIVPVSRLEREKMGPLRDEVVDMAKRTADDVMERGRSIVNDTLAAASESATKHGQALAADIEQEFRTIASST
jgi:hypothetical protein